MTKIWLLVFVIVISCKENSPNKCFFQDRSIDGAVLNINGCMNNSIEDGYWIYSDSLGKTLSEGMFNKGLLTGEWKYSFTNQPTLSIDWLNYSNRKFNVTTNIPQFLTNIEEGDFYIKMKPKDTINKLTLVISIHDSASLPFPLERYYTQSENEITERGWNFRRITTELESRERRFYMNFYNLEKDNTKRYIWNSYGPIDDDKVLEISVNYDNNNEQIGRILFTSVVSNIFVNGKRYLYPYQSLN